MKKLPIVRWFDDLKSALSIYIAGNVAPSPNDVTAGKFYFWKGKVRFPTSNISSGETLTDSNMPVVPEGGLNKVIDNVAVWQTQTVTTTYGDITFSKNPITGLKNIAGVLTVTSEFTSFGAILPSGYTPSENTQIVGKDQGGNTRYGSLGLNNHIYVYASTASRENFLVNYLYK